MGKTKRIRSDSYATEIDMVRAKPPCPPPHLKLPENVLPHWWGIIRAREYSSWTEPDLEHAANLACCLYNCERLRMELHNEKDIEENVKGMLQVNPKHGLLDQLTKRAIALSRLIHVHAEATTGKSRDNVHRSQKQREIANNKEKADDDGLIAKRYAQ